MEDSVSKVRRLFFATQISENLHIFTELLVGLVFLFFNFL